MDLSIKDFNTLLDFLRKYKIRNYHCINTKTNKGHILIDTNPVYLYFERGRRHRDIKKLYKICAKYKNFSLTFIIDPTIERYTLVIDSYKEN